MGRRREEVGGPGPKPGPGPRSSSPTLDLRETREEGGHVLVEVKVQSLGLDRASNTPVVILQELEGERVLPIWIGPGEASAIAMQLADMKFSRPLTHDLLVAAVKGLGGRLKRVVISRVSDSTYFAELVIHREGEVIKVDARPSDSIAVALRSEARIFANDALLERASIEIAEEEEVEGEGHGVSPSSKGEGSDEETAGMDPDELKEYLRRMNPEDFGRFSP